MNRKINNEKIMISICPVSNIKKTCKNSPKISFKGVQPQEPLGVYDYVVYRQAKSDAKKILDSKRDVIRISKIENQRAQSIINSQIKKVQFAIEQTPERIKCRDGKTYMVDSFTGRLSEEKNCPKGQKHSRRAPILLQHHAELFTIETARLLQRALR